MLQLQELHPWPGAKPLYMQINVSRGLAETLRTAPHSLCRSLRTFFTPHALSRRSPLSGFTLYPSFNCIASLLIDYVASSTICRLIYIFQTTFITFSDGIPFVSSTDKPLTLLQLTYPVFISVDVVYFAYSEFLSSSYSVSAPLFFVCPSKSVAWTLTPGVSILGVYVSSSHCCICGYLFLEIVGPVSSRWPLSTCCGILFSRSCRVFRRGLQ